METPRGGPVVSGTSAGDPQSLRASPGVSPKSGLGGTTSPACSAGSSWKCTHASWAKRTCGSRARRKAAASAPPGALHRSSEAGHVRPRRPWPAFPAPALIPVRLTPRRPLSSVTATRSSGGNGTGTDPTEHPTERPPRVSCARNTFHHKGPGDVTCAAEQVYCPRPLRSPGGRSQKPAHRAGAPYPAARPTPHTPGLPALPACGSRFIVCSRLSGAVIGKIAGVEGVEHDGLTCVYIVSSLPQSR